MGFTTTRLRHVFPEPSPLAACRDYRSKVRSVTAALDLTGFDFKVVESSE